jgi:carbonic anhydrase/acetyltransferase-like protein (isoleucine patch superfamily)
VGLGAVVTIGAKSQDSSLDGTGLLELPENHESFLEVPLECVEVAGRSLLERLIERFVAIDAECVTILVEAGLFPRIPPFRAEYRNVTVKVVRELYSAITQELADFSQKGIGHAFINSADAYAETDLLDLFSFHREARQSATRTFDKAGPLALWVVDCAKAQRGDLESFLHDAGSDAAPKYFVREYVSRLLHPRDLRQLAGDILRRSCVTGPSGKQIRPGVWIDNDAEVHRRARIVAPAYLGCASKIKADALITRFSNIERECCVDSGTVVEDSSILPNTSVGICLDLCHAVASGNKLWNLERDVVVEIVDPSVMRFTSAHRKIAARSSERMEASEPNVVLQKPQMPETWQFENNLIQE